MISILIADNNISNIKTIINSLASNKDIKIDYIAFNCKEILNAIIKLKPNLVILNFNLENSYPFKILSYGLKNQLKTKFIIINVSDNNTYKKLSYYNNVLTQFSYNFKVNNIVEFIYKYNTEKKEIEKNIIKELQEIGYSITHKGTKFLAEIIEILIDNEKYEDFNLKNDLYPIIAKKHKMTINSIKLDIFNATESMYCNCEMTKLYNYFHIGTKPNLKEIIYRVVLNIFNNNYCKGISKYKKRINNKY